MAKFSPIPKPELLWGQTKQIPAQNSTLQKGGKTLVTAAGFVIDGEWENWNSCFSSFRITVGSLAGGYYSQVKQWTGGHHPILPASWLQEQKFQLLCTLPCPALLLLAFLFRCSPTNLQPLSCGVRMLTSGKTWLPLATTLGNLGMVYEWCLAALMFYSSGDLVQRQWEHPRHTSPRWVRQSGVSKTDFCLSVLPLCIQAVPAVEVVNW